MAKITLRHFDNCRIDGVWSHMIFFLCDEVKRYPYILKTLMSLSQAVGLVESTDLKTEEFIEMPKISSS